MYMHLSPEHWEMLPRHWGVKWGLEKWLMKIWSYQTHQSISEEPKNHQVLFYFIFLNFIFFNWDLLPQGGWVGGKRWGRRGSASRAARQPSLESYQRRFHHPRAWLGPWEIFDLRFQRACRAFPPTAALGRAKFQLSGKLVAFDVGFFCWRRGWAWAELSGRPLRSRVGSVLLSGWGCATAPLRSDLLQLSPSPDHFVIASCF